mmetsp:Transcript_16094/g.34819  ORF Transcript_16094/g.34819 Transcript_16094/m.34819 type:complete len:429 (-) Transcript_16094:1080-2366(-)|eukprot:CAMPEP_0202907682 /NCGR_PEP_ID=MMETSP1392-20130828/43496_1 /ASSEMBLY_ACC=CAM_ASM_000868 /TAXON_ID=225041 /ORGANISM="Chlamydomonas chlamydogama, Strain SAG 11-48b" /LENGTH=428 /DNA_ID=CAMNT_0049596693 /DNA_START=74 /DNA_END=1360 /DNA_ORIENTATION=-
MELLQRTWLPQSPSTVLCLLLLTLLASFVTEKASANANTKDRIAVVYISLGGSACQAPAVQQALYTLYRFGNWYQDGLKPGAARHVHILTDQLHCMELPKLYNQLVHAVQKSMAASSDDTMTQSGQDPNSTIYAALEASVRLLQTPPHVDGPSYVVIARKMWKTMIWELFGAHYDYIVYMDVDVLVHEPMGPFITSAKTRLETQLASSRQALSARMAETKQTLNTAAQSADHAAQFDVSLVGLFNDVGSHAGHGKPSQAFYPHSGVLFLGPCSRGMLRLWRDHFYGERSRAMPRKRRGSQSLQIQPQVPNSAASLLGRKDPGTFLNVMDQAVLVQILTEHSVTAVSTAHKGLDAPGVVTVTAYAELGGEQYMLFPNATHFQTGSLKLFTHITNTKRMGEVVVANKLGAVVDALFDLPEDYAFSKYLPQ